MKLLWDVDTQEDFIRPYGGLPVPDAEKIIPGLERALREFSRKGFAVMGSVDAHVGKESIPGTDQYFPLHCIKGTSGQQKITSTLCYPGNMLYVADQPYEAEALDMLAEGVKGGKRLYFEKQKTGFLANPNAEPIIRMLGITEAYIMGVATNICVYEADKAFKGMGIQTYLIEDAIKGIDLPGNTEAGALEHMLATGTRMYRR